MASVVRSASMAPNEISRLVKPPRDCCFSSSFILPKHDSKTSVLPGNRSPVFVFGLIGHESCQFLRQDRGARVSVLARHLAAKFLGTLPRDAMGVDVRHGEVHDRLPARPLLDVADELLQPTKLRLQSFGARPSQHFGRGRTQYFQHALGPLQLRPQIHEPRLGLGRRRRQETHVCLLHRTARLSDLALELLPTRVLFQALLSKQAALCLIS